MSKEFKDSWLDSGLVYIVFALANAWFILAWLFDWTDFGHNARAAGGVWHVFACLLTVAFWAYTYRLATDKVEGSKGLAQAVFALLLILIPFFLCGFTFSIAS